MPDGAEGTKEHRGAEDVVQLKRRGSHQHNADAGDINWGESEGLYIIPIFFQLIARYRFIIPCIFSCGVNVYL